MTDTRERFAQLASEFADYPLDTLPEIPAAWQDSSWHNDACPFFIASDNVGVFVDYADPTQRDMACAHRFMAMPLSDRMHVADPLWTVESDDWNEILSACIAAEFVAKLRDQLTESEWAEMRATNVHHVDDGVCASHDYCDANVPMSDAFETITGREPLGSADASTEQNDADCDLWNRAWEIAKARDLTASEGEAK